MTTSKTEDQVECWLFLDVVVRESAAVFELLSSEDETLLIWGDTFLVLDLCLNILNGVWWLNIKSDGFTSEGFDEDLHTTTKSEDEVKGWLLLNVVVRKSATVFELLSSEDETLLIWGDTFFVLDLGLDIFNWVWWFDIKSDGLACESFDENLHLRLLVK